MLTIAGPDILILECACSTIGSVLPFKKECMHDYFVKPSTTNIYYDILFNVICSYSVSICLGKTNSLEMDPHHDDAFEYGKCK